MKYAFLTLFFLLALPLNALAKEPCRRQFEPAGRFSYCPPNGWSVYEKEGDQYKWVRGKTSNDFTPNINFKAAKSASPLSNDAADIIKSILAGVDNIKGDQISLESQSDFVLASGQRGIKVVLQVKLDAFLVRSIQYYFRNAKDDGILIITCTALNADKEVLDNLFDRSIKTLKIE